MEKLTDPNPYDVLQISRDANRQQIKRALADRQKENKGQLERQQALRARNALASTDARLVVDALTPDFADNVREDQLTAALGQATSSNIDWLGLLDEDQIMQQDFRAYLEVTIRHVLGDVPPPASEPQLLSSFDGLDEFLTSWLK